MAKTFNSKPLSLEEKEKIKVMAGSGQTFHAIATTLNRSPHTIKRYLQCPEAQEHVEQIKEELSDLFENLARKMVSSITDADVLKLNAYQRTLSSGIAVDKMRLLKDQSTQNISLHEILEIQKKIDDEIERRESIEK